MAEPSDRPAINDGLGGRKKGGCRDGKKKGRNEAKKVGKKLILFQPGLNYSDQPGEVDTMR